MSGRLSRACVVRLHGSRVLGCPAGYLSVGFAHGILHTRDPIETCLGMSILLAGVPWTFVIVVFLGVSNKTSVASFLGFYFVVCLVLLWSSCTATT